MISELSKSKKTEILGGVLAAMLLSSLVNTIVATAMPKILSALGGIEYLSWALTSYMLASTIAMPIFGKLSDMYGRKPFYIGGIAIFLAGCIMCGFAKNMQQFVVYRAIAGLGGGIMQANSMAIVADIFPPAERGKYQGLLGGAFGLASIIGPTLGGLITDNWNWSWVFWVNVPIGVIAIAILAYALPWKTEHKKGNIDYLGAAALITAFTPMLLAFTWAGSKYAWGSPQILGLLGFSLAALLIFVFIENKAKEPIVPLSLFKNPVFNVSVITGFLMSIGMFGSIMYIPLFVQGVIGQTATNSGVIMTPMMVALILASTISGQIVSRTGKYKFLALLGFLVMTAGMFMLSRLTPSSGNAIVSIDMIVLGVGLGIGMPIFVVAVQSAFPHKQVGVVTSSVQFFRSIGGTFGVAVMGSIMNSRFKILSQQSLSEPIKKMIAMLPPDRQAFFTSPQALFNPQTLETIRQKAPPAYLDMINNVIHQLKTALSVSITDVLLVATFIVGGAFVATFFLKEIPLRKTNAPSAVEMGKEMLADNTYLPPESEPDLADQDPKS